MERRFKLRVGWDNELLVQPLNRSSLMPVQPRQVATCVIERSIKVPRSKPALLGPAAAPLAARAAASAASATRKDQQWGA